MLIRSSGARAAWLGLLLAGATHAAPDLAGRWEGKIAIPGAPQWLIVDLDRDEHGAWIGSAILPGRGVKGAALGALAVEADSVRFDLAAALPFPAEQPPEVSARLDDTGGLQGEFRMNGLAAPLAMRRSGAAQVDRPPPSQPIDAAMNGTWTGSYELLGMPRQVTLKLGAAGAEMTITRPGRTTQVPFTLVRASRSLLSLSGNPYDIGYEGELRAADGILTGTFLQGPIELPLELRRGR